MPPPLVLKPPSQAAVLGVDADATLRQIPGLLDPKYSPAPGSRLRSNSSSRRLMVGETKKIRRQRNEERSGAVQEAMEDGWRWTNG